ncbi:MAG TPA: hypothetical protein PLI13_01005 [Paracoccus sp. (in: a-proteobacteria)]|nr:hypothetical protein [Paracoccus sp. (in: a-proteobacteria)]
MPWMTYNEAAAALGIKPDSVRRQARKRNWPRRTTNSGLAQVDVPPDRILEIRPAALPEPSTSSSTDYSESAQKSSRISGLEAALAASEKRAAELVEDRDQWRIMAKALLSDLATERSKNWLNRLFGR